MKKFEITAHFKLVDGGDRVENKVQFNVSGYSLEETLSILKQMRDGVIRRTTDAASDAGVSDKLHSDFTANIRMAQTPSNDFGFAQVGIESETSPKDGEEAARLIVVTNVIEGLIKQVNEATNNEATNNEATNNDKAKKKALKNLKKALKKANVVDVSEAMLILMLMGLALKYDADVAKKEFETDPYFNAIVECKDAGLTADEIQTLISEYFKK